MKIFANVTTSASNVANDAKWILYLTTNITNFKTIWKDANGTELNAHSGKYKILISKKGLLQYQVVLQILNVASEDAGHYQFQVKNDVLNEQSQIVELTLIVNGNVNTYLM